MNATCPPSEELRELSCGRMNQEESAALLSHLEQCGRCQAEVDTVADTEDSLIADLRAADDAVAIDAEAGYQHALAKALGALSIAKDDRTSVELPQLIGDYEIVRRLGQGGMGNVFLARHTKLGRESALKLLADHRLANPRMKERFDSEMRAIGRLSHPNIVTAHDAREIDGVAVLAMEFVDGFNLSDLVRRVGPLSIPDACEIARQVATALAYIDSAGFVHRDIKPSNVMLSRGGEVKVLDLGLARLCNDDSVQPEQTGTGQTVGTADYVSPEQVCDSRNVDIRADIYSLGCTLYKLLTGRAPFAGAEHLTAFSKMNAHVSEPAPSLLEARPDTPGELARLVDLMLQKSPSDRPQNATVIEEQIAKHATGANLARLAEDAQVSSGTSPEPTSLTNQPSPRTQSVLFHPVPTFVAIAAGLLGTAVGIALGILITIKHPDGTSTKIEAPEGSSVVVSEATDKTREPEPNQPALRDEANTETPDGLLVLMHAFDKATFLEDAVKTFNTYWKKYDQYWPYRELEISELTKAIKQWDREALPIDDAGFSAFQRIAETKTLPDSRIGLTGPGSIYLSINIEGRQDRYLLRVRDPEPGKEAPMVFQVQEPQPANPELTQVKIPVYYANGRPAVGAEVSMTLQGSDERPVKVTSRADANGVALERALPYGKYYMTERVPEREPTGDGSHSHWVAELYDVLLEFGGSYTRKFIAPDPGDRANVELQTSIDHRGLLEGLAFGNVSGKNGVGYGGYGRIIRSPEPGGQAELMADFPVFGRWH